MAPRDLAVVIYSPFPRASGGRETWLAHVLPALASAGYRTTVYAQASRGQLFHDLTAVPDLRIRGIATGPAVPGPLRKLLLNLPVAAAIATFIRRTARQLANDGFKGGVVLGLGPIIDVTPGIRLRKQAPGTRVACIVHGLVAEELGHTLPWARPFLSGMELDSLLACDAIMANGEDTRDRLRARGVDAAVVPNGVDVAAFGRLPSARPKELVAARERGEAVLTMIATLRDIKGIRPFIASLPALRRIYGPGFRAVFVGKGDAGPYRQLATRLGVGRQVSFVGERPDVVPWLHGSDISVNLSGGTGIAISAIEALAAGTAVVAWDSDIYRQIIQTEENGLLVPEGNAEALAVTLARLLKDAGLRQRLAANGKANAARFDWSHTTARLLAVLGPLYQR